MISASSAFTTANAILQKTPIYLIQITSYSRAFTNLPTGVSGQYDWIVSVEDMQITINDLDGGADLGAFTFNIQDRGGAITGDFPSFVFEGKAITCKTGYPGMLQSDYALLFTGRIDTVSSANGNSEYQFSCIDNSDVLTKVIYQTADDGFPTNTDHRRTLNGHPLDILENILINEIGLSNTQYNIAQLRTYKFGVFAGVQFLFSIDSPPAAKDFIEQEILKPLGGYIWTNSLGQIDFNFFRRDNRTPFAGGCLLGAFTDSSGVVQNSPFFLPVTTGQTASIPVPPGATKVSFGVSDTNYTDNSGAWNLTVNGTSISVGGKAQPYDPTINTQFYFNPAGTTAAVTLAVTAGTIMTVAYVSGTVAIGGGFPASDPLGYQLGHLDPLAPVAPSAYCVSVPQATVTTPDFTATNDTMLDPPEAEQADLINTLSFRFDKASDGKFAAEAVDTYTVSVAKYGQFGQQIIESGGMRSGFQGFSLANLTAQIIFLRYGLKNLQFAEVILTWGAVLIEPGDLVAVTSSFVPDRAAGVMGITGKLFEVLDRTWNFNDCTVHLKLLDASYLTSIGAYLIAPAGIPAFTSATTYQKNRYMFLCNNSDQYSDGTPAHPLG